MLPARGFQADVFGIMLWIPVAITSLSSITSCSDFRKDELPNHKPSQPFNLLNLPNPLNLLNLLNPLNPLNPLNFLNPLNLV